MLIEATEAEQAESAVSAELANTTSAWLARLAKPTEEVEEDTPDAFLKRQRLVRLLVDRITVGIDSNGETAVEVTYRFGPPEETVDEVKGSVGDIQNSCGNLAVKRKPSGEIPRHFRTVDRRGVP